MARRRAEAAWGAAADPLAYRGERTAKSGGESERRRAGAAHAATTENQVEGGDVARVFGKKTGRRRRVKDPRARASEGSE